MYYIYLCMYVCMYVYIYVYVYTSVSLIKNFLKENTGDQWHTILIVKDTSLRPRSPRMCEKRDPSGTTARIPIDAGSIIDSPVAPLRGWATTVRLAVTNKRLATSSAYAAGFLRAPNGPKDVPDRALRSRGYSESLPSSLSRSLLGLSRWRQFVGIRWPWYSPPPDLSADSWRHRLLCR